MRQRGSDAREGRGGVVARIDLKEPVDERPLAENDAALREHACPTGPDGSTQPPPHHKTPGAHTHADERVMGGADDGR